jgi:hypothetical protein
MASGDHDFRQTPPQQIPGYVGALVLLANLAAFGLCACFALARNINGLFYHFDGSYMLINARNQLSSHRGAFYFSNDILQATGNMQFLQNAKLLFYFYPIRWFADLATAKIGVYLIITTIVFLSGYGLARLLSQDRLIALVAGWILGVVTTPIVPIPSFYPILNVAPNFVLVIASPVIALWLVRAVGRASVIMDVAYGLTLGGFVLYLLAAGPQWIPLVGPGMVLYSALALFLSRRPVELLRKIGVLALLLIVAICLQWPWYLLGLFSDTSAYLFPHDFLSVYKSTIYASIFFHGQIFGWIGPSLVLTSTVGAIICLRSVELRPAAGVLLVVILLLASSGFALVAMQNWLLPPPIYLEVAVWPLYGLFTAVTLCRIAGFVAARFKGIKISPVGKMRLEWMLPLPATVLTAVLATCKPPVAMGYPFPPRQTAFVELLRANVALAPHSGFNGRVATIIPVDKDAGDPWSQQYVKARELAETIGNDEMSLGLWYYHIPTVFEDNEFVSPAFHALVKRALQPTSLPHARSVVILASPNVRVLQLLGVRYVISPRPTNSIGALRATEEAAGKEWDLFELPAPNLATYSPTSVEVRNDLESTFDFVMTEGIDLAKSAVTQEAIGANLTPLRSSSLSMVNGDLHVVARSAGRSLVIVPLEFSRCIELHEEDAGNGVPRASLIRVDGLLTGIVFERDLDALLAFRISPLRNALCRWRDYQELKVMLQSRPVAAER